MSEHTLARNLIGGEWSAAGSVQESVDPSTGEAVGTYVSAGRAEAGAAIAAARTAFDTTGWSRDPALRSRALFELADRVAERVPALSRTLTRENGKRLDETAWEAAISVDWLRYSAASALTRVAGRAAAQALPGHGRVRPDHRGT